MDFSLNFRSAEAESFEKTNDKSHKSEKKIKSEKTPESARLVSSGFSILLFVFFGLFFFLFYFII